MTSAVARVVRQRSQRLGTATLLGLVLVVWLVIVYFPLYWTVITSLKQPTDISFKVTYLPWVDFEPSLHAWRFIFGSDGATIWNHFVNGAIASLGSAALAVVFGAMAAYGLTRLPYRLGPWRNNDIAFWFISQRMMPPVAVVMAFLVMYKQVGLLDSRTGLTLAYTSFNLPLAIWLMRDFFQASPRELEEAAFVDGASRLRAFWGIVMPLAVPGLVAVFVLSFIFSWNEFLFALVLTFQHAGTVPLLLASEVTGTGVEWWRLSALTMLSIVPSVLAALVLERRIESGLFRGGVK